MKIVHICLMHFTDEMSYQENLLVKYHMRLGFDVTVIAPVWKYEPGRGMVEAGQRDYVNQYGIHVVRLGIRGRNDVDRKLKRFAGLYEALCSEEPDILFMHGCQYMDITVIVKYIRRYAVKKVYVDNHADFSNSATNWLSKNILHKIIWKHYAHRIEPYTARFYGVLPARVDFLIDQYQLPEEKCKLLIMGADDELVIRAKECREETRKKYNIGKENFLIVTGGKINQSKWQTVLLEKAVGELNRENVRLILFGSIDKELQDNVMDLCNERILYVGWLSAEDTYLLIAASDLAIYPGRHSVLWEQTAGQAVPMIAKHWDGTHHIDAGGNAEFLYKDSSEEIKSRIEELLTTPGKYNAMKQAAEKCADQFLYSSIAKESIGLI